MSLYCTIIALCYINYTYIYIHQVVCSRIDDPSIWCERSSHNCRRFSTRLSRPKASPRTWKSWCFMSAIEMSSDFSRKTNVIFTAQWVMNVCPIEVQGNIHYTDCISCIDWYVYIYSYTLRRREQLPPSKMVRRLLFLLKMVYFLVAM